MTRRQAMTRAVLVGLLIIAVGAAFVHSGHRRENDRVRTLARKLGTGLAHSLEREIDRVMATGETLGVTAEGAARRSELFDTVAGRSTTIHSISERAGAGDIVPDEWPRCAGLSYNEWGDPFMTLEQLVDGDQGALAVMVIDLDLNALLRRAGFEQAAAAGYSFALVPTSPGAEPLFVQSLSGALDAPEEIGLDAVETWRLQIAPTDGWPTYGLLVAPALLVLILASAVSFSVFGMLRQPALMGEEIRRRKERLRTTYEQLSKESSERVLAEERARDAMSIDPLTGLRNRAAFIDEVRQALERARTHGDVPVAIILFDLDGFTRFNTSMGTDAGDRILREIAQRLRNCLREEHVAARVGADEFSLMVFDCKNDDVLRRFVNRLRRDVARPLRVGDEDVSLAVSVGSAQCRPSEDDALALMRNAGIAMKEVRNLGGDGYMPFDASMRVREVTEMETERELRRAVAGGELCNFYQPILRLADGRVSGFESLIRWNHPEKGLLPPGAFLPVAEKSDLILQVDRWAALDSLMQLRKWQERFSFDPPMTLNINLSGKEFSQPDLVPFLRDALRDSRVDPTVVTFEITESVMMDDPEGAVKMLNELKALDVKLSVDDFGTGYSSLNYLSRFPVDSVKIDRSFVWAMETSDKNLEIVRAVVELANRLGMKVVAEGIETDAHLAQLRTLACTYGQGYLFAKPLPVEDAEKLLQAEEKKGPASAGVAVLAASDTLETGHHP